MKPRRREIGNLNPRIALKFDRHIDSTTAEVHINFQSDRTFINTNLAASRLCEILQLDVLSGIEMGLRYLKCPSILNDDTPSPPYTVVMIKGPGQLR